VRNDRAPWRLLICSRWRSLRLTVGSIRLTPAQSARRSLMASRSVADVDPRRCISDTAERRQRNGQLSRP
jgi:hypothetical protein